MRRLPLLVAVAVASALALSSLAACSGERPSLARAEQPAEEPPPGGASLEVPKLATVDPRATDVAVVATAIVPDVAVYDSPDAPEPSRSLDNPIASGGPLVFLVDRTLGDWHQVLLPGGPAGTTGWVRAANVTVARHNYRIDVHLSEFRLDVYLQGELVRQLKIGVGKGAAPTPGGRYYTTELVQPATADPVYGSYAFSLSGFGDGVETFAGAPGQLGIHGTDEPESVGTQPIDGSIRMSDEDIEDLTAFLPLGVPVTVDA